MTLVMLKTSSGQVRIRISLSGLESMVSSCVRESQTRGIAVISDSHVDRILGPAVEKAVSSAGGRPVRIVHPAGEIHKNLETADFIYRSLFKASADRSWLAFALGGGVTGDLAGFAASTYMRGIPYVQIPTTLMAQADSSVGGKVGVNHPKAGKNMIGLFAQPREILIDPALTLSMKKRDFMSGFAEIVKYGIILDGSLFERLEKRSAALANRSLADLESVVADSVRIKASVVEQDEKESGARMVLNLGHTIGHAIEAASARAPLPHGEAVSIGISAASRLAVSRFGFSPADARRIDALLAGFSLPLSWPRGISPAKAARALRMDKKFRNGLARIVVPVRIGEARIIDDFPLDDLAAFLVEFARSRRL